MQRSWLTIVKPETGQNTQGGVRFDKRIDNHFIGANLTVFQTNIDDYNAEEYQRANQSYLIYNLGDVEIKGFEASLSYGYEMFNSKLSYARSDTKNKDTGGAVALVVIVVALIWVTISCWITSHRGSRNDLWVELDVC
ncbi:TonB-dependent receptor [Vibrio lentus]|nr:TonB-dependent receptor [Vibrio lentus]